MTVYKYSGRTLNGSHTKGTITADSKQIAIAKLRKKGINPREIYQSTSILHREISIGKKVSLEDFVIYCRQFATLIRAGISIVDATHILAEQTSNKEFQKALRVVGDEIRSGKLFSEAAEKNTKVFPALFINMIRAGEATGSLDETLEDLAVYYEKQHQLKSKIQSAVTYPIVLFVLTMFVSIFLMVSIVPRFTSMYADFDAQLPFITIAVMAISNVLKYFWWLLLLLLVAGIITFQYLIRNNEKFKFQVSYLLLKLPIFGRLFQKAAIARLTRTLASLYSSSVPILQALTIVEKVVNNPVLSEVILDARANLEKGNSLTAPLEKSWLFPPLVTQMTAIGEQTGSLDMMLSKIADFYEADVERSVDTLKSLIEPLMIVFLAVIIGTIVLAIMIPMFSLYDQMI